MGKNDNPHVWKNYQKEIAKELKSADRSKIERKNHGN